MPEQKYRRPDQYYIDSYDRHTIEILKDLEAESAREAAVLATVTDPEERMNLFLKHTAGSMTFHDTAVRRARSREELIRAAMSRDEQQDRIVASHPPPTGITCRTCSSAMYLCDHFFDFDNIPLLFLFQCPNKHKPKRAIHPDGREYFFPKPTCKKCGHEVHDQSEQRDKALYIIETCPNCGNIYKDQIELRTKEQHEAPISDEDRKQYCLDYKNRNTFYEDLEAFASIGDDFDARQEEKQQMEAYEIHKIEKLTIPVLEARLQEAVSAAGYIKLVFDRPEMKVHTTITFNLQDPTDREKEDSIKKATTSIKDCLEPTNWRIHGKIDYRLGYLSGKLKGYERDEDLLKLTKEKCS